jgi:hypothetical protein
VSALDQVATPLAALLWLQVVSAICILLAAPVIGWWAFRTRRKHVEDFERRRDEIRRGARRAPKSFTLHRKDDVA